MERIARQLCSPAMLVLGFLPAQSPSVLGRENAQFARLLLENGYPDLAEGMCQAITGSDSTRAEVLEVEALRFDLRVEALRRDPDLENRKSALRAVIEEENKFVTEHARSSVANVIRANLPSVYLEYAGALNAVLAREQDPAKRAALVQEGEEVFAQGENALEDRIRTFEQQLDDGNGDLNYAQRQLLIARFCLPRMDYHHSLLYAEGSPERELRLKSALERFQDFGFDFPDSLQNYQGIIYQGLCHEALGLVEDALVDYTDAVALRELFVQEGDVFLVGPEEADLVSGATLQLVRLLTSEKRYPEALAAAEDFLATIPDALATSSGPEVLAAKAEAEIASGDISAAGATAQRLADLDPQGWAGRTGRELLARLPVAGLPADKLLRIAETSANRGEFARSLDLLRRAREAAVGAADEQEVGAAAFLLTGRVLGYQDRIHEASLAYDCAFELYPQGSKAPEALNAAVNAYRDLARKERMRYYAERADDRMQKLARNYPQHPLAANAGIWQGMRREDERDFAGAIDFYRKIDASSPSYSEASYRLAKAMHEQARDLARDGSTDESKARMKEAEEQYRRALDLLARERQETLDAAVEQRLAGHALNTRLGLAELYLDVERPDEVLPLLADLEKSNTLAAEVVAGLWSLRIRALEALGRLEEATSLFDSLLASSPDDPGLASAAGVLARALDRAATNVYASDERANGAEELWRKSAHYYWLSVKSALEGGAPLRPDDVTEVAQRLYVIGLFFNSVPEGQNTFVDWQGTVSDPGPWEDAARIYARLDAQAPSYRVSIERARTLALLGKMTEAEGIYARLFDQNSILPSDESQKGFDMAAIEARPELVPAYLEWGVATQQVGLAAKDQALLDRAAAIYARMLDNTTPTQRTWWQAKYFQINLLAEQGDYENADRALRNVERTTDPQFDKGQFGFKDKFLALKAELKKKIKN